MGEGCGIFFLANEIREFLTAFFMGIDNRFELCIRKLSHFGTASNDNRLDEKEEIVIYCSLSILLIKRLLDIKIHIYIKFSLGMIDFLPTSNLVYEPT